MGAWILMVLNESQLPLSHPNEGLSHSDSGLGHEAYFGQWDIS